VGIKPQTDGTLRTRLDALTLVNRSSSTNVDLIIREQDSLALRNIDTYAGRIDVELAAREATLVLQSGSIRTRSGGNIRLVADDMDFISGNDQIVGTGQLEIRSKALEQHYHIGGYAQSRFGDEYSPGMTGFLELGSRDLSAIAPTFAAVTIGHRNQTSVQMLIGDVRNETILDRYARPLTFGAQLDNPTTFLGDQLVVRGDLVGSKRVTLAGHTLKVERTSLNNPMGAPASGITANEIELNLAEQIVLSGWLRGGDSIDIDVTASSGSKALMSQRVGTKSGAGINTFNSLTADPGVEISIASNRPDGLPLSDRRGLLTIDAIGSIVSGASILAGKTETNGQPIVGATQGIGAIIDIRSSQSGIRLLEGATVAARADKASVNIQSHTLLHVNSGAAVTVGARFNYVGASVIPVLTGVNTSLTLNTSGELLLAGSVTSGGRMNLVYGQTEDDYADYFDTINGRTLTSVAGTPSLMGELLNPAPVAQGQQPQIPLSLVTALNQANLPIGFDANANGTLTVDEQRSTATLLPVSGLAPFASLSVAEQNALATGAGFEVFASGGVYKADASPDRRFVAVPTIGYSLC
jgi:hypothetical protein